MLRGRAAESEPYEFTPIDRMLGEPGFYDRVRQQTSHPE